MNSDSNNILMIGAPFAGKLSSGKWIDIEFMKCITIAYNTFKAKGFDVYCAHVNASFGQEINDPSSFLRRDVEAVASCNIFVGITDGTMSTGLALELGIAYALQKRIVLLLKDKAVHASYLCALTDLACGEIHYYSNSDLLRLILSRLF
jgi:hypothetical protein